jgi:hypothetical protein
MSLVNQINQKNKQLIIQQLLLLQQLRISAETPELNSFLITFVAVPFMGGVIARLLIRPGRILSHSLLSRVKFPFLF